MELDIIIIEYTRRGMKKRAVDKKDAVQKQFLVRPCLFEHFTFGLNIWYLLYSYVIINVINFKG